MALPETSRPNHLRGATVAAVRIIAVSYSGGKQVENISYVWTAAGATTAARIVDDIWYRRCSYYTVAPSGRVAVTTVPAKGPGLLARVLGAPRPKAHLQSHPVDRAIDSLLSLPHLPSPDRGRRSQQQNAQHEASPSSA
jgi:hypothetical protein